jgi:hypothetical protein
VAVIALGAAEATVLAAVVPVLVVQAVQVWQGHQARQQGKAAAEQFKPNGGSSLRDAVDRLEYKVDKLHDRHDHLADRILLIEDHVTKPRSI